MASLIKCTVGTITDIIYFARVTTMDYNGTRNLDSLLLRSRRLAARDRFISRFKRPKAPSRMQIGTLNELIHTTFGWL